MSGPYTSLADERGPHGYGTVPRGGTSKQSSPRLSPTQTKIIITISIITLLAVIGIGAWLLVKDHKDNEKCVLPEVADNPPAPSPERVQIEFVPLPPTAPSYDTGSCSAAINPRGTGCLDPSNFGLQSGSFLPDDNHIVVTMNFSGAPAAPAPSSIYSGLQVVILKVDGTTFSNGDSWKCITCGIPASNSNGSAPGVFDYPQTFHDGMRLLAGANVIDCSPYQLVDDNCSPNVTFVYPLRWVVTADGSGAGGSIRELRLHPNNNYLGFNSITITPTSQSQLGFIGSLFFNKNPTTGIPLVPRYDIVNVTTLYSPSAPKAFTINPNNASELFFNPYSPTIGEFRGWSKDGQDALFIGLPCESGNFDIMSTNLATGATRRLTRNPGYTDPVDMSPDNMWTVVMDTRATDRLTFAAGMRGIPPLSDLVTTSLVASIRNNGQRRFFEPYLIDIYGDRGDYQGQLLTAEGDGSPGSINDPNWNGMADPRWSANGTMVAFWQALVTTPDCGGINPLPCPNSTEPGGRRTRILIARLVDREATAPYPIPPVPETIPWGTPYIPGNPIPPLVFPAGVYTLHGNVSGTAVAQITTSPDNSSILSVSVNYTNYSDDGYHVINGEEYVEQNRSVPFLIGVYWKSNLTLSGCITGRKFTSENGYSASLDLANPVVESTGTLSTTLGNVTYTSPSPGT